MEYKILKSDELYHWKYIRRERVNGKWRYYYEKNDDKLELNYVQKKEQNGSYFARSDRTKGEWVNIDKDTYGKVKQKVSLSVGPWSLKSIRKDTVATGKQYVNDLMRGKVYRGRKIKRLKRKLNRLEGAL